MVENVIFSEIPAIFLRISADGFTTKRDHPLGQPKDRAILSH
jgi:hypothetical protein